MKPFTATVNRLLTSALAGAALLTLICAGSAGAQIQAMLRVPDQSPGFPGYTLVPPFPYQTHTDQWAAIVFYRNPNCVPNTFNLLEGPDTTVIFITGQLRAFACPLTISGFELWDKPGAGAPRIVVNSGSAVPVWFVRWPDLQAAIKDGVLTKTELESLAPLKGVATKYNEIEHAWADPSLLALRSSQGGYTLNASGTLPDGRSFQFQFTNNFGTDAQEAFGPGLYYVNIVIQ